MEKTAVVGKANELSHEQPMGVKNLAKSMLRSMGFDVSRLSSLRRNRNQPTDDPFLDRHLDIFWGDGTFQQWGIPPSGNTKNVPHVYPQEGKYKITIIPVSAGTKKEKNCPTFGWPGANADGCARIGPKPPAFR